MPLTLFTRRSVARDGLKVESGAFVFPFLFLPFFLFIFIFFFRGDVMWFFFSRRRSTRHQEREEQRESRVVKALLSFIFASVVLTDCFPNFESVPSTRAPGYFRDRFKTQDFETQGVPG